MVEDRGSRSVLQAAANNTSGRKEIWESPGTALPSDCNEGARDDDS
jgi:hypothetical protein